MIRFISETEVKELMDMESTIQAIELGFREKGLGRVQMPPKSYLFYHRHQGDMRTMPCYLEGPDISAIKVVNVHPENRGRYSLPTVMATLLLIDTATGVVKSIMGGTWLTAMRTGAAGGVAAKYLARPDTRTVGIVGAGVQARTQLMAVASVLQGIEEVRVTDLRNESRETFVREMSSALGLEMVSVESTEAAVRGSDLVVATVPTREPCIRSEWIEDGAHVNAIGGDAPGKQELSMDFWTRAKIVVDDWEQAFHSGDINVPCAQCLISKKDVWAELGDIVAGKREGRTSDREVTVFDSTGVAVQDAMAADLVYRNALERNMGHDLEM